MKKIKVYGCLGLIFDNPKYVITKSGKIKNGDWIVFDGIIQQFDEYFVNEKTRFCHMIKVEIPEWI